ncbi:MAG: lysylphosphatidylglycerol synthase transmembrane domain-containing protein, partial [Burkholderiaceae bacterium]
MNDENTRDAASITSRPGSSGAEDVLGGTGTGAIGQRGALRTARWFSWIFGFAMLTAVIIAALHFSEEREILSIAEKAQPWWLAIAIILQAGTYLAQGETWRVVTRAAGVAVPSSVAFKLSLANLFINQALPSGGISGTVVVARALEQRGVPRTVVMASVLVDSVAYYGAYVLTLAIALLIAMAGGRVSPLILAVGLLLVVFSAALTTVVLILSGRRNAAPKWFTRIPLLRSVLSLLSEADPALVRNFP